MYVFICWIAHMYVDYITFLSEDNKVQLDLISSKHLCTSAVVGSAANKSTHFEATTK